MNFSPQRFLSRCFAFAAFLSLCAAAGCGKAAEKKGAKGGGGQAGGPVPVNVAAVQKKAMPVDLRTFGSVEPISSVAIKAQVGGELIGVQFQEGKEVQKGQSLFSIQPKLFATRLAEAEANLARDRVTAGNAEREAQRAVELSAKGAVSKEQLEQTRAQAEAAAATVRADEALVEIAKTQVGYTTVKSPIDGITGAVRVKEGNLITANADEPLVVVNQIAPIYVNFALPEYHLARIRKEGDAGQLGVTAVDPRSNEPLGEGKLTFISNAVDTATGTITLKATFPNADRALWPGAYVEAILHLPTELDAIVAPSSAIMAGQDGQQTFVVKADGSAELRKISVSRVVGGEAVVSKGLSEGETVVTNGQSRLIPGAKVSIKPEPGAKPPASPSPRQGES